MQLLNITTTPIKYRIETDPAHLKIRQRAARFALKTSPAHLEICTRDIELRLDMTAMRGSIGLKDTSEFLRDAARAGMRAAQEAAGEYARMGNRMARIQDGVTVSGIVMEKVLRQPSTHTVFLPSQGPDISWQPADVQIRYEAGSVQGEWERARHIMDYIPGRFDITILQYPRVHIKYQDGFSE